MGRHKKEINWNIVEKQMEARCTLKEIAGALRVDEDTLSKRFKEQYGKYFSDKSGEFQSAGAASLRFTQYMKALSGNIPMLTLLGREVLGQGKDTEKFSPYEDILAMRHENMLLKAELAEIKEKLNDPR